MTYNVWARVGSRGAGLQAWFKTEAKAVEHLAALQREGKPGASYFIGVLHGPVPDKCKESATGLSVALVRWAVPHYFIRYDGSAWVYYRDAEPHEVAAIDAHKKGAVQ